MSDRAVDDSNVREWVKILYEENGRNNRFLVDWRHRVLVRFFIALASLLYVAKWFWENDNGALRRWVFVPFLIASGSSALFWIMDKRNKRLMILCTDIGGSLESIMLNCKGFYTGYSELLMSAKRKPGSPFISYTVALSLIYLCASVVTCIMAIACILKYWL